MGLVADIATRLAAGGFGTLGTNLFIGYLPDQPDVAMAVYGQPGVAPISAMGEAVGAIVLERPNVQILCRGVSFPAVETAILATIPCLEAICEEVVGGKTYHGVWANQSYPAAWRDDNNRVVMSLNFRIIKGV